MPHKTDQNLDKFHDLPLEVSGSKDLASLLMETENMRDAIKSLAISGRGSEAGIPPRIASFFEVNGISKVDQSIIDQSIQWLKLQLKHAPKVHFALNTEPDLKERSMIVGWLRREVLPTALVEFSLYPGLGGGAIVRTPVRIFDFSVKSVLQKKTPEFRQVLIGTEA
jgi:hypothetical protein